MSLMIDNLPDLSDLNIAKRKTQKKADYDETVPQVLDAELASLGWSPQARLSFLGNTGRENSWNRNTIFDGHYDAENGQYNYGIISWQKDRQTDLQDYLKKNGGVDNSGKVIRNDNTLRLMARFADDEMSRKFKPTYEAVRNRNLQLPDVSKNLDGYISYVFTSPKLGVVNTPDKEYGSVNNRTWALRAKNLGLGSLPNLSDLSAGKTQLPELSDLNINQTQPSVQDVPLSNGQINNSIITAPNLAAEQAPQTDVVSNLQSNLAQFQTQLKTEKNPKERKRLQTTIANLTKSIAQEQQTPAQAQTDIDTTKVQPSPTFPTTSPQVLPDISDLAIQKSYTKASQGQEKYQFEIDGKTSDGMEYLGTLGGKYRVRNEDGDEFELDEQTKQFKILGKAKRIYNDKKEEYLRSDDQTNVKEGTRYTRDGKTYIVTDNSIAEENPKLTLGDKDNPYTQSDDQKDVPADKVRVTDKDGKTYLAAQSKDNQYSIERELPAWVNGKTKPKTALPNDAQLRKSYQTYLKDYGLRDSEELRKKATEAYASKTPILSGDEKTTLDELRDNATSQTVASQTTKRQKSTRQFVSTPARQNNQFDFERTGTLKTNEGELKLVRGGDGLQQGEYRFEDEKGETYIVNPSAKEIKDESLAQPVEAVTVKLSERGTDTNMARTLVAADVANVIAPKYQLPGSDVIEFYRIKGFSDWQTGEGLPDSRLYKSPNAATETLNLTRRDLEDIRKFSEARRDMLEQQAIEIIGQGRELTADEKRYFKINEIDLEKLAEPNYSDIDLKGKERYQKYISALQKGEGIKADFQKYFEEEKAQTNDAYIARVAASGRVGWLPREAAQKEIEAYQNLQKDARNEIKKPSSVFGSLEKAYTSGQEVRSAQQLEADAQNNVNLLISKYGSATNYNRVKRQKEIEEIARQDRIAKMPMGEYLTESVKTAASSLVKSVASSVISSSLRGAVLFTEPIAQGIDSVFETERNYKNVKDHPMYKASLAIDEYLKQLPTNKDLEQSFVQGSLPQGVGSAVGLIFPSLSNKPKLAIALFSTIQMGGDGYKDAIEAGATEQEAQLAGLLSGGALGWTEIVGVGEALARLNRGTGASAWRKMFRDAWREGSKEAGEEVFLNELPQTIGQNIIAKNLYDPDRKDDQDLAKNLATAGVTGGLVSGGVTIINTLRNRGAVKKLIEEEQRNGIAVKSFGENEISVFGEKIAVTEELKPLVDSFNNSRNGIAQVQGQIAALTKQAELGSNEYKAKILKDIIPLRKELSLLTQRQTALSQQIVERSGIEPKTETVAETIVPQVDGTIEPLEASPIMETGEFAEGRRVEIKGKGAGEIVETKDKDKFLVEYNGGKSRMIVRRNQLTPIKVIIP